MCKDIVSIIKFYIMDLDVIVDIQVSLIVKVFGKFIVKLVVILKDGCIKIIVGDWIFSKYWMIVSYDVSQLIKKIIKGFSFKISVVEIDVSYSV